jgi:hypothetical protein
MLDKAALSVQVTLWTAHLSGGGASDADHRKFEV